MVVTTATRSAYALLAGWIGTALPFLALTWQHVLRMDAAATQRHAGDQDRDRRAAHLLVLLGVVASVAAVGVLLSQVGSRGGPPRQASVALALSALTVSWLLVHTVFALRYADAYYREAGDDREPPIDFGADPRYLDFFYVAFTVGTTFAVSDTDVRSTRIRRLVLPHSLLSFLFGAVVVGATVNLVTSLTS